MTKLKFVFALLVAMVPSLAHAGITASDAYLINKDSPVANKTALGDQILNGTEQLARVVWDVTVNGGSTGTFKLGQGGSTGRFRLGQDLPDKAIIKRVTYQVVQKVLAQGSPQISLGASTSQDLVAPVSAQNLSANQMQVGTVNDDYTQFIKYGASTTQRGWPVQLNITGNANTYYIQGKVVFWVEYVISE